LGAAFQSQLKNKSKRQKKNLDKLRENLFDGSKVNNLQKVEKSVKPVRKTVLKSFRLPKIF